MKACEQLTLKWEHGRRLDDIYEALVELRQDLFKFRGSNVILLELDFAIKHLRVAKLTSMKE